MWFKTLYYKYRYFFNLMVVLVLLITIRMLDWIAWTPPGPGVTSFIVISHLFEFLAFMPMVFLIIFGYRWALKRKQVYLNVILIFVFAIAGPILIKLLATWLKIAFWNKDTARVTLDILEKYVPGAMVVILFLSATFCLTHLWLQFTRQREAVHRAENLAREVRLKMLHYQINPHFLFNVLNSIHALIDENSDKAKKLVVEMSEYYRYTLNKPELTTSIDSEIGSVVKYLEIQKTRFEDDFEFEISVDVEARAILIPSFIIHLLVENAVKYGKRPNEQKLIIRLTVKFISQILTIAVANTGKLGDAAGFQHKGPGETGNSIENIKSRLALLYHDSGTFSLTEENGWVIATIEITLQNR